MKIRWSIYHVKLSYSKFMVQFRPVLQSDLSKSSHQQHYSLISRFSPPTPPPNLYFSVLFVGHPALPPLTLLAPPLAFNRRPGSSWAAPRIIASSEEGSVIISTRLKGFSLMVNERRILLQQSLLEFIQMIERKLVNLYKNSCIFI